MTKNKRKSITKKLRFEVFKRDNFTCQYCGKNPPGVVLEVDHIQPVAGGGTNDINNLITSCFDCNRGKSNIPLERITPVIAETLDILKQKEEQLREYRRFVASIKRRETKDIGKINSIFEAAFPERTLTDTFKKNSVGMFLRKLPLHEVEEAMEKATSVIGDSHDATKYFCGICWRKIKGEEI